MNLSELKTEVERLYEITGGDLPSETTHVVAELRAQLQSGGIRAAEPGPSGAGTGGGWIVNTWVKKGILLGFRAGRTVDYSGGGPLSFQDKDTFPPRRFGPDDEVRVVPGGSSIRDGAFVGRGVVCMPPMFVNVGAYVDDQTMIDSHALVGSCAQIGKRVHLSAGVQIGGVLEPVGAMPVIIEDDVLVGGNCGVYEGTIVGAEAVLAPGTILTRSTPLYDLVRGNIVRAGDGGPLAVPPRAVVVPGSRPARGEFATAEGVRLYAPVIVKYRDPGTAAAVALEEALR